MRRWSCLWIYILEWHIVLWVTFLGPPLALPFPWASQYWHILRHILYIQAHTYNLERRGPLLWAVDRSFLTKEQRWKIWRLWKFFVRTGHPGAHCLPCPIRGMNTQNRTVPIRCSIKLTLQIIILPIFTTLFRTFFLKKNIFSKIFFKNILFKNIFLEYFFQKYFSVHIFAIFFWPNLL